MLTAYESCLRRRTTGTIQQVRKRCGVSSTNMNASKTITFLGVQQLSREWVKVLEAAVSASRWHSNQRRKGAAVEPYINHLLEVAMLVAEATEGRDPKLVIAALLHDAMEDQEVSRMTIAQRFGEDVALLVTEVTDDKSLTRDQRKSQQVKSAPRKSARAKILKLADKTSNLAAIAASPPLDWSVKQRAEYIQWARDVASGLRGVSPWLETKFEEAAERAERSTGLFDLNSKDRC